MTSLTNIGWNNWFNQAFEDYKERRCKEKEYYRNKVFSVARVTAQFRHHYTIMTENGEREGILRKVFLHEVAERADLPSVGDWVVLINADHSDQLMIDGVLPRISYLGRNSAGTPGAFVASEAKNQYSKLDKGEQILCANVDTAFVVTSLNQDFNLRRLERYLSMVWNGGVQPVILLTKADLCTAEEIEERIDAISSVAFGVPFHIISAIDGTGLGELEEYWCSHKTMVLTGSSGVGKSTLINTILGYDKMRVKQITGYKDKGQHTTTHKELIILQQGGIIIDTPGIRELRLTSDEASLSNVFGDVIAEIEELSKGCKFRNCKHESEPGCAVKEALETGELSQERWKSYKNLLREIRFYEKKQKAEELKSRTKGKRVKS